ncbi:MAG: GNAT family N-acetyltransferase [Campylobacterota bacterium]|nr:GNAT family N-acetyltransferase [Campylobacterota bacterium]
MPSFRLVKFDIATSYKGIKTFDCGNEMINTFVRKSLKRRVKKHLSQAYVLLDTERDEHFVGFYTLDTFSIARDSFETNQKPSGLPPVIPVIKLGMLGVSRQLQGKGIGKKLLRDALFKVMQVAELAGCAGIYLLAEKDAVPFYESLGFVGIKDAEPLPMFLEMGIIVDSVG